MDVRLAVKWTSAARRTRVTGLVDRRGGAVGAGRRVYGGTGRATRTPRARRALFRPATEQDVSATEYRVAPPDKLQIRAGASRRWTRSSRRSARTGRSRSTCCGRSTCANKTPDGDRPDPDRGAAKYYNNVQVKRRGGGVREQVLRGVRAGACATAGESRTPGGTRWWRPGGGGVQRAGVAAAGVDQPPGQGRPARGRR